MADNGAFDSVVAYLTVDDGHGAIAFYEKAFGARCDARMPSDDGRVMHASLTVNGGTIMLSDDIMDGGGGTRTPRKAGATTVTIHLEFDDPTPAWERAVAAGAEVVMPFDAMFWGARYGKLRDPFGHVWSIGGPADGASPASTDSG